MKMSVNRRYVQIVAALTACATIASSGFHISWSSPSLPKLSSNNSPLGHALSTAQKSWIASAFLFGYIFGAPLSGIFLEHFGRKKTLLFTIIPMTIPWIMIAFTTCASVLILARVVAGIGGGMTMASVSIYCGEIADNDIRGKLSTAINLFRLTGSLYVLSVGPYVSYQRLTLSCIVVPMVCFLIFVFMPESPYYLIKIGELDLAQENQARLSRKDADKDFLSQRLNEIQKSVDYDMQNKSTIWNIISGREYRRSLYLMFGVKTLQQFSGINAIDAYLQTIVETSGSSLAPEISSVICGVIQIPAAMLSTHVVDKIGRRPLLIASALGCALALLAEGTFFYMKTKTNVDLNGFLWIPTVSLMFYLTMHSLGAFPVPYLLAGELFSINIKSAANAVFLTYGSVTGFLVVKFFEPISNAWGMYTLFWIFAGFCLSGAIFVYLCLPETKGKDFLEIQKELQK